jgi:acyl phosphate:glycerol-3-phosphate acyltransferase
MSRRPAPRHESRWRRVPVVMIALENSSASAVLAALAFGYLLGSIPFGLVLTRLAGTADIRTIGSGNIGATNVLRTGHKGLAAATLVGDALKGAVAVLAAASYGGEALAMVAAAGAFLGHLFPFWLKFHGGKGVATFIGILAAFAWPAAVLFCLIWLGVAAVTRYSSLSALVASAATPPLLWYLGHPREAGLFTALALLLWFMHRANIARLLARTETRLGLPGRAP